MIYDDLAVISRYRGLHPNIDVAIDYVLSTDLSQLSTGRHDIFGEQVFLLIQANTLNAEPNETFEYHKQYMDLQFLIKGNENFRFSRSVDEVIQEFDQENDYGLIRSRSGLDLELDGQTFVMVWPDEHHQPGQIGHSGTQVRKCVIKILID